MSEGKVELPKPSARRTNKSADLDPKAVATLKSQIGEDVIDVLRLDEGAFDLRAVIENATAQVARRRVAMGFNEVALQRRMYENEIVRHDVAIFKELAGLVQSIGERYRVITGLPPMRKG